MITVDVVGTELLAARFKAETRAFQLQQRVQMRIAANLVKADVQAKVMSLFPTSTTAHKRRGATSLGPLRKKIAVKVFNSTADVVGLIRPSASGFYGRFQETGLSVMRQSRSKTAVSIRSRKSVKGSHPFRLPAKPFLAPVAEADAAKVTEILGDSYEVFHRGGA
jgi:hypothetical protein